TVCRGAHRRGQAGGAPPGNAERRMAAAFRCASWQANLPPGSALARLETRVGLADHEDLSAAADHLAVAVTGLRRLQGGQDFHDTLREDDGWGARATMAGALKQARHSSGDSVVVSSVCAAGCGTGQVPRYNPAPACCPETP